MAELTDTEKGITRYKVGRPPKFESVEELSDLIQKYFNETPVSELTITGLCLSIGTNRQTLCDYEEKDGFKEIVKEAKMIVENAYELSLRRHGRTGDIFALKNFGWKDKTESDINHSGSLDLLGLLSKADGQER